ncbi:DEAD/DEAH box helicase [Saccharibacillus brassicae]|uniref:DEAD/DEAH box helicase n=2 Tax=Saccharibacillus TaxID=456492 RepID=UPI0039EA4700
MKASLYAAGDGNERKLYLSLDLEADFLWWGPFGAAEHGNASRLPGKLVSSGMPLQWAARLSGKTVQKSADHWSTQEWERYIRRWLAPELAAEDPHSIASLLGMQETDGGSAGQRWMEAGGREPGEPDIDQLEKKRHLNEQAHVLGELLEGRSLLGRELLAMIREIAPGLERDWKAIVQWAYLQGRLTLSGAVEKTAGAGPSRLCGRPSGEARQSRLSGGRFAAASRAAHRCVRCGSEAAGGPCAACGSADCARCEACRALGRSRSCEPLLQSLPRAPRRGGQGGPGAAPPGPGLPADAEPEAALRARLARWKLSPAQTAAAELAVRFLEAEPGPARPGRAGREPRAPRRVPHASAPPPRRAGALRLAATAMLGAAWPGARPDTSGYAAADPASRFLLWAVTGAGKTEMLFPLIESALRRGGRVLVATPRRDVVLELAPRLRRAFPHEPLTVLYGGSEERWHRGVITLATTHQLLRFARAFDLVVIDELDAFPFHGDPMLSYAAEICRADGGRTVYLSATPPRGMLALVRRGRLACAKVPVRYHRHPLPVPELLRMLPLAECLRRGRLPDALLRRCGQSLRRGAQLFVFVPKIAYAERLAALLRRAFPGVAVGATSSQDGERGDKVLSFRSAEVRILVTTTILERGVTVPRSDVYILDADSRLFDEASLVQMAGRAGRSAEDPSGCVVFASAQHTAAQAGACRQIRRMNGWAKPFLLTAPGGDSSPVHSPEGPKR